MRGMKRERNSSEVESRGRGNIEKNIRVREKDIKE